MGIYKTFGVEYSIILNDDTIKNIIPIKDMDTRLLNSLYYTTRDPSYDTDYRDTWRIKIHTSEFDFTPDEHKKLETELYSLGSHVKDHGWYDVGYIAYTLDFD